MPGAALSRNGVGAPLMAELNAEIAKARGGK